MSWSDENKIVIATRSGQKTVTTAGTEVALGTGAVSGPILIKALTTNTGLVYVGYVSGGTVSSSTGYPLAAGDVVLIDHCTALDNILVDSAVNGEGVSWISLNA